MRKEAANEEWSAEVINTEDPLGASGSGKDSSAKRDFELLRGGFI